MAGYQPQQTIRYKTYVKKAVVEALRAVFYSHRDEDLRSTTVEIGFPTDKTTYPMVLVHFYERSINNAGVGHIEWIEDSENPGQFHQFKHYLFKGDLEFSIFAQSNLERDLVGDAIVETLAMGQLEAYTRQFLDRIYNPDIENEPAANETFLSINTDQISPYGETQAIAPWLPEDELIYQSSYRVEIYGEIYNRVFDQAEGTGLIEHVDVYPYRFPIDPEPEPNPHPEDPAQWS